MAQSTGVMREPTMDEIMTSIREIITENTAQTRTALQQNLVTQTAVNDRTNAIRSEKQEGRSLSVEDAMSALARRIGLEEEKLPQPSQPTSVDHFASVAPTDALPAAEASLREQEVFLPTDVALSAAAEEQISTQETGYTGPRGNDGAGRSPVDSKNVGKSDTIATKVQEGRRATSDYSLADNASHSNTKPNEPGSFLFNSLNFEVEHAAEDVLRPLISQWLNNNLPKLINQILKEELAKTLKINP